MAIQQVASGSQGGIMSFLFQDDGSAEGSVLEGAEFAKTLHQLLGEYEGGAESEVDAEASGKTQQATSKSEELAHAITDPEAELKELTAPLEGAEFTRTLHQLLGEYEGGEKSGVEPGTSGKTQVATPTPEALAGVITGTAAKVKEPTAPLTAGLEDLLKDFKLPAHSARLPAEAGFEGEADGQEVEQPFWGIAPFTDVMAALREHTPHANATDADAMAANDIQAEHASTPALAAAPVAPAFGNGIAHVIEMARDSAQVSAELAQPLPPQPHTGRNAPQGGKLLPQGLRGTLSALNPGQAAANAKSVQSTAITDIPVAMPTGDATVSNTFFADLLNVNAEAPSPQPAAPQATSAGIHALHPNSPVANLPKAADPAPANPMPHMQSQHVVGSDAWFQDLGARVDWLKDMKVDKAELQLHPAELGLLEIQISTGDDGATVSFVTHNLEARNLIEESMPRLRELLANQGMQLGQSHVSQHSEGQRRGGEPHSASASARRNNTATDEPAPIRHRAYVVDPNRIDHYV